MYKCIFLLLFSLEVMSQSLQCHGLQLTRLPCPSLSPGICLDSCSLSQWCHPTISYSVPPSPFAFSLSQHQGLCQWVGSLPMSQLFESGSQSIRALASVLPVDIQLISFRNWLVGSPWSPKDSQESSLVPQFKSIHSSVLPYSSTLTFIHDHWKNQSFAI